MSQAFCRPTPRSPSVFLRALVLLVALTATAFASTGWAQAQSSPTDSDQDGIPDTADNCISLSNNDQADLDQDHLGDACDDDRDGDGVKDQFDNCPTTPNGNQTDDNHNGQGDVCEPVDQHTTTSGPPPDRDGDGFSDAKDVCPTIANHDQSDIDHDGIGDMCDIDADGDGIVDSGVAFPDNCPTAPNHDQKDSDEDGTGNVCDATPLPLSCATCTTSPQVQDNTKKSEDQGPWMLIGAGLLAGTVVGVAAAALLLRKGK